MKIMLDITYLQLEDYFRNRWSSFKELSLLDQSNDYPSENQSDAGRSAKAKEEMEKERLPICKYCVVFQVSFEIISLKFKYLGIWKQRHKSIEYCMGFVMSELVVIGAELIYAACN